MNSTPAKRHSCTRRPPSRRIGADDQAAEASAMFGPSAPLLRGLLRGRRPLSTAAARLVAAHSDCGSGEVTLRWEDGEQRSFHRLWLRDNCAASRHSSSRQKLTSAASLPSDLRVRELRAERDRLHVTWCPDGHVSDFSADWLRQLGAAGQEAGPAASPPPATTPNSAATPAAAAAAAPVLPRVAYDELVRGGEPAVWRWLSALHETGATLLTGVPCAPEKVTEVARLVGPVQPQIYGEAWDVVAQEGAINIAYTGEPLAAHMDLCYYESPPGLQLLHCLAFDDGIVGGESTLVDAFAVAEALRRDAPDAFATLARIPATFVKDHANRDHPVLMSYRRPHLALSASAELVGVFWSPPFEGPLLAPPADVPRYYAAYRRLHESIEAAPAVEHRLRPGEMLVFNNRRMLHGRRGFSQRGAARRHLRGCYVNIDEFANRFNLLRRRHAAAPNAPRCPIGNQDWGRESLDAFAQ
jgi:alpha-ketoglutarate-dependent taurine dioxygenase